MKILRRSKKMLDINWQILAYAGIFLTDLGVLIACVSAARTLGVRKSLAAATECVRKCYRYR